MILVKDAKYIHLLLIVPTGVRFYPKRAPDSDDIQSRALRIAIPHFG